MPLLDPSDNSPWRREHVNCWRSAWADTELRMTTDTKPFANVERAKRPPQFTLRQTLLAIGGLCVLLAFFRLVGL